MIEREMLQNITEIANYYYCFSFLDFYFLCECLSWFVCVVSRRDNSSSTQMYELLSWMNGGLLAVEIALRVINHLQAPNCLQLTCRDLLTCKSASVRNTKE